jgi:flagellar assembly factor FliW
MNMNIDTPHAGSIGTAPDHVIEFPEGLAGFEDCRRFTLYHPETPEGAAPRYFIQHVFSGLDYRLAPNPAE